MSDYGKGRLIATNSACLTGQQFMLSWFVSHILFSVFGVLGGCIPMHIPNDVVR